MQHDQERRGATHGDEDDDDINEGDDGVQVALMILGGINAHQRVYKNKRYRTVEQRKRRVRLNNTRPERRN